MTLVLYSRPGCHLCEELEQKLRPHMERLRRERGVEVEITRRDIDADKGWHDAYWDRIPVLMLGDRVVLEGNPTPSEINRAMAQIA